MDFARLMLWIGGESASAEASLASVAGGLGTVETQAHRATGALEALKAAAAILATVGVVAAGIGIGAVKMAGDFQSSMTQLVTGAGEAEKNIGMISKAVLGLAGEVGYAPKVLALGLYNIGSAGFHGKEGLEVLRVSAIAAKVGLADFPVVADAVTSTLRAYHMAGTDAHKVTDALLQAVSQGKMHFQDLAGSLGAVLPTASAVGVKLNDVLAAMSTMTQQGDAPATAATHLRFAMLALTGGSEAANHALHGIGLSSTDVAKQLMSSGSLYETLKLINERLGATYGTHSPQAIAALKEIMGGVRGMGTALEAGGNNLDVFLENLKGMETASQGAGKTMKGWEITQKDFNVVIDRFKGGLEAVMITWGTQLLPVAGQFGAWLLAALPHVERFGSYLIALGQQYIPMLVGALQQVWQTVGPAVTTVLQGLGNALQWLNQNTGIVGPVIVALVAILGLWTTMVLVAAAAHFVLAFAEGLALLPMLLIALAIVAIIAVIILLYTHWDQVIKLWERVRAAALELWTNLVTTVTTFGAQILALAEKLWSEFTAKPIFWIAFAVVWIVTKLVELYGHFLQWLGQMVVLANQKWSEFLAAAVTWLGQLIPAAITALTNMQVAMGRQALELLLWWVGFLGQLVTKALELASRWNEIGAAIVQGIWNGIVSLNSWLGDRLRDFLNQALAGAKAALKISSPSELFAAEVGVPIVQGIQVGIDRGSTDVLRALRVATSGLSSSVGVPAGIGSPAAGGLTSIAQTNYIYESSNAELVSSLLNRRLRDLTAT